jgi:hypothetical protein
MAAVRPSQEDLSSATNQSLADTEEQSMETIDTGWKPAGFSANAQAA